MFSYTRFIHQEKATLICLAQQDEALQFLLSLYRKPSTSSLYSS